MATLEEINIGQAANDRKGDPLRNAMQKVNTNFSRLNLELKSVWDSKGAANGIAPLDANGRLPIGYAPYSQRLPNTAHDLNTYTAPGVYVQATSAGVSAGANYPIPSQGWLEVIPDNTASSVVVMQRFTARASSAAGTRVFVRTQTGTAGSWVDWTEIPNFAGVFGYMGNMPDSPAPNLNDYTQRGIWIVGSSSAAANGTNFPIGNSGVLLVLSGIHPGQAAGTTGIVQVYVAANSNRMFFRTLVSNVWRDWEEAVRTSLLGAANGVATLDANKKVPQDQIPGVLGKSLGVADNLNDFDTPGTYYMNSNATALPELNYPVVLAGMLMVEAATGGNLQVTQLYVTNPTSNPRMFLRIRFGTSKTWGPWFELARFDQAMTHTYLTGSGVDMNKLTADNTYYTWNSSAVQSGGVNFPPSAANSSGSLSVVVITGSWMIQTCSMTPSSTRRPIVFQRIGNGSTTWGDWRVTQPISIASDLPTANCGDVYVDGVGMHSWIGGAYVNVSLPYMGLMAAGQDLNTYLNRGVWTIPTAAAANSGSNFPIGQAGNLEVFAQVSTGGTPAGYVVQRYTSGNSNQMFTRTYANGTWTAWKEYADMATAITQTTLSSAADANTLTTPNTRYIWTNGAVVNSGTNWPSLSGLMARGFVDVVAMSSSQIYQRFVCTLASNVHPIVFERYGSVGGTWYSWRVAGPWSPTSFSSYAPTADYGDLYVDGVGWHRWNAGLSKYALAPVTPTQREGLGTEWVNATSILVKPGRCASTSGDVLLELTANNTRTVQTSGAYVHGASGNGLLSGTRQAGWWYYVFLLRRDSDGLVAVAFDTSVVAANRPAGYSHYRRIGTVRTDASNNLMAFTQIGNEFWFDNVVRIYTFDAVVAGTTYAPGTGTPGPISHTVHLSGWATTAAGQPNLSVELNHPTRGGGRSEFVYFMASGVGWNQISDRSVPIYANPSVPTLQFRVNGGNGNVTLWARGYTDHFED
ncbi:hypothetical protein C1I89_22175 [Achromobacter pulmonis]|uniref:Tail fiber protein n=1 Tax=Achromobacter pulmonis TaxID=1389932 RepID=A0A2N8KDN2_9BURK|nr:pyocin knob domain-containing protein [Achromobacter pulmonis]PND31549.1 hypothetical protein C1I89_22175 [Achromobacter pulmonis]